MPRAIELGCLTGDPAVTDREVELAESCLKLLADRARSLRDRLGLGAWQQHVNLPGGRTRSLHLRCHNSRVQRARDALDDQQQPRAPVVADGLARSRSREDERAAALDLDPELLGSRADRVGFLDLAVDQIADETARHLLVRELRSERSFELQGDQRCDHPQRDLVDVVADA